MARKKSYQPVGLNIEEVNERFTKGLYNEKKEDNLKTNWQIISGNLLTFLNLILVIMAILLLSVQSYRNMMFIVIAAINTGIGIFQEFRARATVRNLSLVKETTLPVIRQGLFINIDVQEIVLDDLVLYKSGKQVVADSYIEHGEIQVSEANITGESRMIKKKAGDILYSGSFVISGQAYCKVTAIGENNYIDSLQAQAAKLNKPSSVILNTLRYILRFISIIIVPFGLMTFFNIYNNSAVGYDYLPDFVANTAEFTNAITKVAGSMVAMVPSGLFLLTTGTFAVSVYKLSRKQTLVQELYSIETLARIDTLCLDKTGTITDGTMDVDETVIFKEFTEKKYTQSEVKKIMSSFNYALKDDNQTGLALRKCFGDSPTYKAKKAYPFNSQYKYSMVQFDQGLYVLGAPEIIYRGQYKLIKQVVDQYAKRGKRVLLLAEADKVVKEKFSGKARAVAIITIDDNLRTNASDTIAKFIESGVNVKVISGDNVLTVAEVSRRAGVLNADKYISMDTVKDEDIDRIANEYNIFGRVTPEQKKKLVIAMQEEDHKVAMIGDGINDILALKQADVSVSLKSATDATRNISHIVLLDDDFSRLPDVVKEGRQIVCNTEKTSVLYLTKTLLTVLITLSVLLMKKSYPFEPIHMFVVETFIVGIPTFFLALEPHHRMFKGKFFGNIMKVIVPGAIILWVNVMFIYWFSDHVFTFTDIQITTIGILSVTFGYWLLLIFQSHPLNNLRKVLIVFALISSVVFILFISPDDFAINSIPAYGILLMIILMLTNYITLAWKNKRFI